jgi:hypothetical protein
MTPDHRSFVDHFITLATPPAPGGSLSTAHRPFIDAFLGLIDGADAIPAADGPRRDFVNDFVTIARSALPTDDAATEFQRVIMDGWQGLVWRVQGAVATRFAELEEDEHRLIRAFEDSPSLLAPIARGREEVTHARLLAWALARPGKLGRSLRQSLLNLLDIAQPVDGWMVHTESTIGPECRVDVDIRVPGRWRCLVELKVDAPERDSQLDDYRLHLDGACKDQGIDGTLAFLTLDGREGDADAEHTPLSFRALLTSWLPLALGSGTDELYLRLWLVSVADAFYGVGRPGPVASWSFSKRVGVLRLLEDLGEEA